MITRRSALQLSVGAAVALWCDRLRSEQAPKLLTRAIPSSGELLPIIGIGTSRRFDVATDAERDPLREVLRELPKLGGKLVDTAPAYGVAETVVGDLVAELGNRKQLFIATKVGAGRNGTDAGLAEMNASLGRLKMKSVDLLQIHNLGGVEVMLPLVRKWKDEGKTRYIGITTSSRNQYEALETIMKREPLDFIQIDYALDNRGAADRILPLAKDRGIAVLTNLPFGRGRVLKPFGEKPVPDWARELGIESWAQFALKYVVSHPAVTSAIPGTAKLAYLRDNLAAARGPLPDEKTRAKMVALLES
ncbi:MAG TPA: aldo/keto reductase [Thermoanaerobaculia bacterium]|jgi:aryl-alcohol dehydrogenase-like predicted oxidoreductase